MTENVGVTEGEGRRETVKHDRGREIKIQNVENNEKTVFLSA